MPCSRTSRRVMAIARHQHHTSRDLFLCEVRNSLPRVAVDDDEQWRACRDSIVRSIEADRWLREHGFDRWGKPLQAPPARDQTTNATEQPIDAAAGTGP